MPKDFQGFSRGGFGGRGRGRGRGGFGGRGFGPSGVMVGKNFIKF